MVSIELIQRLDNKWNPGPTVVQWVHGQHPMLISLVSLGNYRMCPWTHWTSMGQGFHLLLSLCINTILSATAWWHFGYHGVNVRSDYCVRYNNFPLQWLPSAVCQSVFIFLVFGLYKLSHILILPSILSLGTTCYISHCDPRGSKHLGCLFGLTAWCSNDAHLPLTIVTTWLFSYRLLSAPLKLGVEF